MRFCVFKTTSGPHLGCALDARGERIVDLTSGWPRGGSSMPPTDVADLARLGEAGIETARALVTTGKTGLDITGLSLLAPIPRPRRNVFCVGRNYREHIIEGNAARGLDTAEMPKFIQLFTKAPTSVIGPGASIPLHAKLTKLLDYEAELAIIIGRDGCDIGEADAMDAVFGYTIVNDVTARDLQRRHDQWFKGKSLDGSCPMGPWVVHKSALADPHALSIRLWVNSELRQNSNTAQMIFKVPNIIADLSAGLTLEAGDVIATGTPSGVGYAMKPPHALQDGDVVTVEIEGIGRLENTVRDAR